MKIKKEESIQSALKKYAVHQYDVGVDARIPLYSEEQTQNLSVFVGQFKALKLDI